MTTPLAVSNLFLGTKTFQLDAKLNHNLFVILSSGDVFLSHTCCCFPAWAGCASVGVRVTGGPNCSWGILVRKVMNIFQKKNMKIGLQISI